MTTVIIDDNSLEGGKLLEYVKRHPRSALIVTEFDNMPLPVPQEELISLEAFKAHMELLAHERLGLKLTL